MFWIPPPGAIGLTCATGWAHVRATIGQMLVGESTTHNQAFVVLDEDYVMYPYARGAKAVPLTYFADSYVMYGWRLDQSPEERERLVQAALALEGTRHGIIDYMALANHRRHPGPRSVCDPRMLVPAQFLAAVYRSAGVPLAVGHDDDVRLDNLGIRFMTSRLWDVHVPVAHYV